MRGARMKPGRVLIEPIEDRFLLSADITPPTARMVVRYFMSAPRKIIVTYEDNQNLNLMSIGLVRVEGPNGFSQLAESLGQSGGEPLRESYRMPVPGGTWDPADNGTYTVRLNRPLKDMSRNAIRNLTLGQFNVALSGTGRIRGSVTNDDPRPLKGVTVYIDGNDDGVFNAGETNVLSDASGKFVFDELPIGAYRIREVPPSGLVLAKSLAPGTPADDPGTGGALDVVVRQSEITNAGIFVNSLNLSFLDIDGTGAGDQITVKPDAGGVLVTINGVATVHSVAGINTLRIHGGGGDDTITIESGIQLAARIFGEAGNDTLRGGDAGETIRGGDGRDEIFGGAGNDTITGSNDLLPCGPEEFSVADRADTIHGVAGDDSLYGGNGNDQLFGDGGNDRLRASSGAATVRGGDGDDIIDAMSDGHMGEHAQNDGNRFLHGDAGDDQILGGVGSDRLFGDSGNDTLNVATGGDKLFGGSGDDVLRANQSNSDADIVDGGSGLDRADVDGEDRLVRLERVKKHARGERGIGPAAVCYSSEGACFLTSAVVHWAGKADDCYELTVLRRFRDSYLWRLPQGPQMIRDYYEHAPRVVRAIEEQGRGAVEWPIVYAMVQEAVGLIEAGQNEEALALYSAEYLRLKAEYVEAAVV